LVQQIQLLILLLLLLLRITIVTLIKILGWNCFLSQKSLVSSICPFQSIVCVCVLLCVCVWLCGLFVCGWWGLCVFMTEWVRRCVCVWLSVCVCVCLCVC